MSYKLEGLYGVIVTENNDSHIVAYCRGVPMKHWHYIPTMKRGGPESGYVIEMSTNEEFSDSCLVEVSREELPKIKLCQIGSFVKWFQLNWHGCRQSMLKFKE